MSENCANIIDRLVEQRRLHGLTQKQLAEIELCISNILKAIESDIYSESVKNRLANLESERAKLDQQLHKAKRKVVPVTREGVLSYLHILKQGDVLDRNFQRELFKNFLVAVYVYDDNRLKIVFSCMGSENSAEIPLEIKKTRQTAGYPKAKKCSFWVLIGPPLRRIVLVRCGFLL